MKTRIGALLLLSVLLVSNVSCQTKEAARPDFGGDGIFSYVPPKGWAVIKAPGLNLKYKAAVGPPVRGFAPNIVVVLEESAGSLDEHATASLETLKSSLEGFTFLEKMDFQTSDGVRGINLVTESDDASGKSKVRQRQVYYLFKSGPKVLAAICTRRAEEGKDVDQAFDAAMKTFRFKTVSAEAKRPTGDRPNFGGDRSFSYVPPPGWNVVELSSSEYKIAKGQPVQGFAPSIIVVTEQSPKSLDEFVASALDEMKAGKTFVFLEKSDFKTSDGVPGIKLTFEFDSSEVKKRLRAVSYAFKAGPRIFFVTCGALAADGAMHDQAFDIAMKTFRFTTAASEKTKPPAPEQESKPPADWKQYSNAEAGISFSYPPRCPLYDQKEKAPENVRKVWQDQLVVCLDLKSPVINFNLSVVKDEMPDSDSFTEWWDSIYDAMCQQQSLTRLSFRGLKVGGRDAAEMVAVNKADLKIKMVSVRGYDDSYFMMAFFAPSKDYDSLDKEVFKPWVGGVKVFNAAQKKAHSEDKRQVWEHTDRLFKDQGNKSWIETDRQGKALFTFRETDRNSDFIEIQDSSRGYTVRLYGNAMHIKGGNRDLKKFDEFTKYCDGKWSAIASSQEQGQPSLLKKAERGDAADQVKLGLAYEAGKGMPKELGEAVKWYSNAADQGNAQGQYNLARMYERGSGVERDYKKAVDLYRKSADQGYAPAQAGLGYMYERGLGAPKDHKQAADWFRKAADQGNARAQNNLGYMYRIGHGVERDYGKALELYRKSAEQGYAMAQVNLGNMYEKGLGAPKDDKQAVDWYRKAVDQGHASGQHSLGYMYRMGLGVERDYGKALELYRKSADQGYAAAQTNLGYMYEKGLGTPRDDKQAVDWYRKAAGQGDALGQNNLGGMYQRGLGVERDYQKALELYRKSAQQSNAIAQCNLGIMCEKGYGVPKDEKEAVGWFRKSAERGEARGQYNLGRMCHQGLGVAEDRQEALKWYQKAAAQGHEEAKKALSRMNATQEPGKHQ